MLQAIKYLSYSNDSWMWVTQDLWWVKEGMTERQHATSHHVDGMQAVILSKQATTFVYARSRNEEVLRGIHTQPEVWATLFHTVTM